VRRGADAERYGLQEDYYYYLDGLYMHGEACVAVLCCHDDASRLRMPSVGVALCALQAWEVLDPPSGWDVSGPVLATGYYHVSATVLQLVMMMDDALAHACHQGEQQLQQQLLLVVWPVILCAALVIHLLRVAYRLM
jgi:hypothetical protein